MKDYRQGAFRNSFERRVFETVRDAVSWCTDYSICEGFPHAVDGHVYHNVQTADFHGELSTTDTFAPPQSREVDVLVEFSRPQRIRLLISGKDSDDRQTLEHIGDYEGLLSSLRSSAQDWLYWAMVVARKGFQSGCEETAKRADIALIPPLTGSVAWLSLITEEEVLERLTDAVKIFTLGDLWRRGPKSYRNGDVYNSIFVVPGNPLGCQAQPEFARVMGWKSQCAISLEMQSQSPKIGFEFLLAEVELTFHFSCHHRCKARGKTGP